MPDRNTKYSAAWLESNMRIAARETILSGFIALASTLVGASLAAQRDSPVVFISAVVGYIALAATILTRPSRSSIRRFPRPKASRLTLAIRSQVVLVQQSLKVLPTLSTAVTSTIF